MTTQHMPPLTHTDETFLKAIADSFYTFLEKGTSRSSDKLKPLHGAIAADIQQLLGCEYTVHAQGFGDGKEAEIGGRYVSKRVDIIIQKENKSIAGIAVKFVMQNYTQNANNYFENMLGETANIRTNNCPYFQVFVLLDKLPYYDKTNTIKHWETFTQHNADKYFKLSQDNTDLFYHTPNKTLLYVVHIPDNEKLKTKEEYLTYYQQNTPCVTRSQNDYHSFGKAVILNDYEDFIQKVYHTILAQL